MRTTVIYIIALFTAALAAAFIAALITPAPYRTLACLLTFVLVAAVMYWLLGLDNVECSDPDCLCHYNNKEPRA